ncbi:peptidoglycan DD-metalloendopeptidase family protein [Halobacillus yeomjeoni]|uniref:Peptidoglycan DD-metalloendopeptidase family protein n=1 Tax=Halobacillus yeomjeoni TaxID=311194 RepID=A0A931HVT0_9BACI|nr:peptidoglycan DD-metalloendopeptidase family protein [Halobacillus yeomjeoni]MBH0230283.1 peptidoglycan DD-metalloendopeptidase family protein [Halobacillus yeomjeoni]
MFLYIGFSKRVAAVVFLGMLLTVGTVYAESNLQTTYHVYVDGKHVGLVDEKEKVKNYVEEKIKQTEEKNDHWDAQIQEEVSFKLERQFSPEFNNDEVMDTLEDEVTLEVDAVGLNIDGSTIAYLPTEEQAKQVEQKLKQKHVDPDTLKKLEERKAKAQEPAIQENQSEVVHVSMSEAIDREETKVSPDKLSTVEETVDLIEKGKAEVHYDLSKDHLMNKDSDGDKSEEDKVVKKSEKMSPLTEVIVKERGIKTEKVPFETEVKKTDDLYKGESEVKQKGKDGEKSISFTKVFKNGQLEKETVTKEETTKEPQNKIILEGTKVIPSRGTGDFVWPAVGGTVTSELGQRWGRMHKGIDIAGVSDRTIKAADHGKVIVAERQSGFGNKVVIDHNNGYKTIYAHLSSFDVEVGDTVKRGSKIGVMGTTGNSTGIHLHFEIHKEGNIKNPMSFY